MKKSDKMLPVPEVGKFYHFWDDGKTGPSRHYICKVEGLITPEQCHIPEGEDFRRIKNLWS